MARFSPKIEIINHFDNLINRIDIDIDNCLQNYNGANILVDLVIPSEKNRRKFCKKHVDFDVEFFNTIDSSNYRYPIDLWTEVIDYLKEVRMKTIEELRKAQDDTLEYYRMNSSRFKSELSNEKNIDELRSELFSKEFFFQINFTQSEKRLWPFNVFTFVTDFYMSPSDIDSLEKLINGEKEPFDRDCVFDDKMVLIGLLYKYFIDNLYYFPSHLIRVYKQDVLNIESIAFAYEYSGVNLTSPSTIDLCKLGNLYLHNGHSKYCRESVKINIEGLFSLKKLLLGANSAEIYFSIRNLFSLTSLSLDMTNCTIDESVITKLLDKLQHIENLFLSGNLSYFNLDNLVNLKLLSLNGTINESFNIELFKNISKQIRVLKIDLPKIDEKTFFKLFDGYDFSNLHTFPIIEFNLNILKKEFISRFPMLRKLFIIGCNLEVIEHDAFSDLKHLYCLDLSQNKLKFIEKDTFSNLEKLQTLDLSKNELITYLDREFVGVSYSVDIRLENKNFETFKHYWHK